MDIKMNYFAKRIIPCLDVDNGRVVKGVNFLGLRDAGDPVEVAKRYNIEGADELTFLDIGASYEGRDTIVDVVKKVAKEVFIPLTVGGGITMGVYGKKMAVIENPQGEQFVADPRILNSMRTVLLYTAPELLYGHNWFTRREFMGYMENKAYQINNQVNQYQQ
jgi:hypothetical protein